MSIDIVDIFLVLCDKENSITYLNNFAKAAGVRAIVGRTLGFSLFAAKVVHYYISHGNKVSQVLIASKSIADYFFVNCDPMTTLLMNMHGRIPHSENFLWCKIFLN